MLSVVLRDNGCKTMHAEANSVFSSFYCFSQVRVALYISLCSVEV